MREFKQRFGGLKPRKKAINLFRKLTIMNQHIISEVYLKHFGYIDKNNQWKVCILDKSQFPTMFANNKRWLSHKSIGSVLSEEDFFDFETNDNIEFVRLIENANTQVESHLPSIVKELRANNALSPKGESILAHYISNLFVRTSYFDDLLNNLIEIDAFDGFIEECLTFNTDSEKNVFRFTINDPSFKSKKNITNISRLLFWNYLCRRLAYFEYYILQPFEGKFWISSDNPVILNDHVNEYSLISHETEIIFPLTSDMLIILKMAQSQRVSDIFDKAVFKRISTASSETTDKIVAIISDYAEKYVIMPNMHGVFSF